MDGTEGVTLHGGMRLGGRNMAHGNVGTSLEGAASWVIKARDAFLAGTACAVGRPARWTDSTHSSSVLPSTASSQNQRSFFHGLK